MKPTIARDATGRGFASRSGLIVAISLALVALATINYSLKVKFASDFHFNPYAILSFIPLTINVFIVVLIMRLRSRSEESVWFVLYLCGLSVACLGEGLQRMSVQPGGALYWFHLNSIGFAIMPLAYYLFVFSYIKPLRSQSPLLIPSLFVSATLMIFFFSSTDLFFSTDTHQLITMPWGYNAPTTSSFPILLIWIEMLSIVALLTLVHFYRGVSSELLRKQSKVYMWAILFPLVGGSFTDGILPLLGINNIVPASLFLSTFSSVIVYYGLRRYRLFQINPAVFAENVIRTMHEAVIVTDTQYKIDFVNHEAERLLGSNTAELSGADISRQFLSESWQAISEYHHGGEGESKDAPIDKLMVVSKTGENIPVSVYTSLLDEGGPNEAFIFIIADISDITASYHQLESNAARIRRQNDLLQENQVTMQRLLHEAEDLQNQLQQEKANVEHTVEVRTAELREARDKLKASDQMKSEFIMLSSHNLRTPLTIMRSSVDMLAGNAALTAPQKVMVNALASSTERLGEFVEDLLTIATLEAGEQVKLVPVKVTDIVNPLLEEISTMADTKGLTFTKFIAADGALVNANTLRLRGAIRNILHNAINFTVSGHISLRVEAREGAVRIIVEDTGIGIAPDELPKMFEKFHRATSTLVYDYQGEGIGLYLTKLVVEEHHGSITAESILGEGSQFTIELPLSEQPEKNQGE